VAALAHALRTGQIAGAGLDVTTIEPLEAQSPLLALAKTQPNTLLISPHIAGDALQR
jgi:phosphoglycerate dehydrogenase-like enzyme